MEQIFPSILAASTAHYSPAIVHNGFVFVSGQLPMDFDGQVKLGSIEEQTLLCLQRIEVILKASNSALDQVLKVNIFVANINDWSKVNAVFAKFFGDHKPARLVVPSGMLNRGCSVEIDCIAATR
jgi:2-iminobutanoate/2-iminopropanoate deaminase